MRIWLLVLSDPELTGLNFFIINSINRINSNRPPGDEHFDLMRHMPWSPNTCPMVTQRITMPSQDNVSSVQRPLIFDDGTLFYFFFFLPVSKRNVCFLNGSFCTFVFFHILQDCHTGPEEISTLFISGQH